MKCMSPFGHSYEGRYDELPIERKGESMDMQNASNETVRSLFVRRMYVRDVCVRCGDVIERR